MSKRYQADRPLAPPPSRKHCGDTVLASGNVFLRNGLLCPWASCVCVSGYRSIHLGSGRADTAGAAQASGLPYLVGSAQSRSENSRSNGLQLVAHRWHSDVWVLVLPGGPQAAVLAGCVADGRLYSR